MAVNLKFIQFFSSTSGHGWSEIHYKQSSSDNPDLKTQLVNFWLNVGLTRKELLGKDCQTIGARVSYPRDGVVASKPLREAHGPNVDQFSAAPALSLAVNMCDSTNTRNKVIHLRGFWDSVEVNETYSPNNPAAEVMKLECFDAEGQLNPRVVEEALRDAGLSKKGATTASSVFKKILESRDVKEEVLEEAPQQGEPEAVVNEADTILKALEERALLKALSNRIK